MFIVTIDNRQKPHRGGISGSMPLLRSLVALPFQCYKHVAPLGLSHAIVLLAVVTSAYCFHIRLDAVEVHGTALISEKTRQF